MSMRFFLCDQSNLTFWTAFLTRIPIGIPLKFRRRLLFPNSNSYDFSAEKYELFLSEKQVIEEFLTQNSSKIPGSSAL